MTTHVRRLMDHPLFGLDEVAVRDLAVGLLLSAGIVWTTLYATSHGHTYDAGVLGATAALLMTLPVIFVRRTPILATSALVGGALLNWLCIGTYVRCGAALPAIFIAAFAVGNRTTSWWRVFGAGLIVANITLQVASDPQLQPMSSVILLAPLGLIFLGLGWGFQHNQNMVAELRQQTLALEAQREINARLAVEADRQRISHDLDGYLHQQVATISATAAAGQAAFGFSPSEFGAAFARIQETGRATLTHMREVVRNMKSTPTTPQPVLAQLDLLLGQARFAGVNLEIKGSASLLSPGLELAGFRIVEHLLLTLAGDAAANGKVEVTLGSEAIDIRVVGSAARGAQCRAALSAAMERAALHGGSLVTDLRAGRRDTVVHLPLGIAA